MFCKQEEHGDSRASLAELKNALENYIGKLDTTIVDSNNQLAVNFIYQTKTTHSSHGIKIFPPAPAIDSETGYHEKKKISALRALRAQYI